MRYAGELREAGLREADLGDNFNLAIVMLIGLAYGLNMNANRF